MCSPYCPWIAWPSSSGFTQSGQKRRGRSVIRVPPVHRTCCPDRTPSRPTSRTSGARRTSRGVCASREGPCARTASGDGGRRRGTRSLLHRLERIYVVELRTLGAFASLLALAVHYANHYVGPSTFGA